MKTTSILFTVLSTLTIVVISVFIKYTELFGVSMISNMYVYIAVALLIILAFFSITLKTKLLLCFKSNKALNEKLQNITNKHNNLFFENSQLKKDIKELTNQYSLLEKSCDLKEEIALRLHLKTIELEEKIRHLKMSNGSYKSNFLQERNRKFELKNRLEAKEKEIAKLRIHCSVIESKLNTTN